MRKEILKLVYGSPEEETTTELFESKRLAYAEFNLIIEEIEESNEEDDLIVELFQQNGDREWDLIDSYPEPEIDDELDGISDDKANKVYEAIETLEGLIDETENEEQKEIITDVAANLRGIVEEETLEEDD
jgi:hypothetical protein